MNNQRRKEIDKLISSIDALKNMAEGLLSEEEDYRDNIPENLQGSQRYDDADEACDHLDDAIACIEDAINALEEAKL